MKRVTVLGCGLVGSVMVRDLASDGQFELLVCDRDERALAPLNDLPRVQTRACDLSNASEINKAIASADVVVGSVPGFMGHKTLETVIRAGKSVCDISFAPEDPFALDALAKEHGVTAIVDAGVSPGLSNLAIGRAAAQMRTVRRAVIYVGGLPIPRHWPFEYRSVFSPTDVIEEYTRPARVVEAGRVVTKPALTEVEPLEFAQLGTLEAFNTDGLRTLLSTIRAENMCEKTLRYPGHADRMRMLREMGLFDEKPLDVRGTHVVPRALTEMLMFKLWARPTNEEEATVLRVRVEGESKDGKSVVHTFDLFDRTDPVSGATSMSRTTGFPCVILARMIATRAITRRGVLPLELLATDATVYDRVLEGLRTRGVTLDETVTEG